MAEIKYYYGNRSLFSDYYLENRMEDHPCWEEEIAGIFQEVQALYQEHRDHLDDLNEAQTEEEFIRPVLKILGFTWDVQSDVERQGRHNYPDYSLFQDEAAKKKAIQHRDDPGIFYSHAIALADAKYWERPLDQKLTDPRDEYTNRNPSFQIINYLTATGLEWGIITNGAAWRLYSTKARSRVDTYYEVNLQEILENAGADSASSAVSAENLRAFKYFYHFFRAAAFQKDPETKKLFLEQVFDESVNYGSQLQTRLKSLIFDKIFIYLAEGFIQHQRQNNRQEIESQENLDDIYEGTLRLLYRLLFILYAEARDLLPVKDEHGYRNYSLLSLKQRAAKAVDRGNTLVSTGHDYWNDLQDLFRFIDQGEPDLNIPRYNGGLFRSDHPKNDFFGQNAVPDKYLVPALDLLTRDVDPDTGQKRFIDYKTLDVEQLGSIYEGLLEFHLRIAEKELAVVKEKGTEVYKALDEVKNPIRTIQPGETCLENDKGQRKATGSYYTPDYIVQYIVENTVGPVLKERADQFGKLMDKIQERSSGRRKQPVKQLERQAVDSLLGIKICDPAMGSGHFLVRATDYLTEQIILELNKYPDNPVIHRIETIRNDVVETLEEQGIAIDRDVLKDTNLLKRMVMKQCIYGVDLNPMAVELAKLSLWLDSFTVGAPLSFLDHHLKVGNSLIGTNVHEVESALQAEEGYTEDLFGSPFRGLLQAANLMRDVSMLTDATFSEVEQSISKYDAFETAIRPYKTILDVWVSQHFGNEGVKQVMEVHGLEVLEALKHNKRESLHESEKRALQTTEDLSTAHYFFHWELEFPEVFIDLERAAWKENPGFDIIISNPPYTRIQLLNNKYVSYFNDNYESSTGNYDIYVIFVEKGLISLNEKGRFGYILPNKFFSVNYGVGIRRLLVKNRYLIEILDFGSCQIFPEAATTYTSLLFLKGSQNYNPFLYKRIDPKYAQIDTNSIIKNNYLDRSEIKIEDLSESNWNLNFSNEGLLLKKIDKQSIKLGEIASSIGRGTSTGDDSIFVVDILEKGNNKYLVRSSKGNDHFYVEESLLRYPIFSTDFGKYYFNRMDKTKALIWLYSSNNYEILSIDTLRDNYPLIYQYLNNNREKLEKRAQFKEWYGFSAPRNLRLQDNAQILIPLLAEGPSFTLYPKPQLDYALMASGGFGISLKSDVQYDDLFILSLINSSLLFFYLKTISNVFRGGYITCTRQYFKQLPIYKINFITPKDERNLHFKRLKNLYKAGIYNKDRNNIKGLFEYSDTIIDSNHNYADVIHDFLSYLAQQMIERQAQKQEEITGFLSWLERFMGTSLDSLTGYTIIQDYYDIPGGKEELLERLAKNKSKIPNRDMTARAPQEKVLQEYEKSMSTLRPLLDRIAKTDRLIDQIVYQLYGLTEEEIRVVEGQ